jgi:hypothetical protein
MASSDPRDRLYEWRTYVPAPGQAAALIRRLRDAHGELAGTAVSPLGLWAEELGTPGLVSALWSYQDLEARGPALAAEEDLHQGGNVALLDHVESALWRVTGYSPEPAVTAPVIELRTYDALPGRLGILHNRFATFTIGAFARHGFENCGYWTERFGRSGRLVYIVGFESLEHRDRAWRAFGRDPDWQAARVASEQDGPLITRHEARILRSAGRRLAVSPTQQETQQHAI